MNSGKIESCYESAGTFLSSCSWGQGLQSIYKAQNLPQH